MKKNNGKTLDIMLDFETMGQEHNPIIAQLAAVPFNVETDEVFPEDAFNQHINPQSCAKIGLTTRGEDSKGKTTMDFWLSLDEEIFNKVILKAFTSGRPVIDVLNEFSAWISKMKVKHDCDNVKIYGNGPAADCIWLRSAYKAAKLPAPTEYWDDNCVRTYVDFGKRVLKVDPKKNNKRIGPHHDAVWDCLTQILWVLDVVAKMRGQDKSKCHDLLIEYAKKEQTPCTVKPLVVAK